MIASRGRRDARRFAALVAAGIWAASPVGAVAEAELESEEAATSAPEASSGEGAMVEETGVAETSAAEAPAGTVPRGVFTRAIADREPTDRIEELGNDTRQIFYFTELQGLDGQSVTHRWEHDGEVKAEVEFIVGGARWRVYSSKNLDPSWLGEWTVAVVDERGRVLRQDRFRYRAEEVPAASAADTAEMD